MFSSFRDAKENGRKCSGPEWVVRMSATPHFAISIGIISCWWSKTERLNHQREHNKICKLRFPLEIYSPFLLVRPPLPLILLLIFNSNWNSIRDSVYYQFRNILGALDTLPNSRHSQIISSQMLMSRSSPSVPASSDAGIPCARKRNKTSVTTDEVDKSENSLPNFGESGWHH